MTSSAISRPDQMSGAGGTMQIPNPQWSTQWFPDYSHLHGVELTQQQCRDLYHDVSTKGLLSREITTLFQNPQEEAQWDAFARAFKKEFRVIDAKNIQVLRFVLDENLRGAVTKANLMRFFIWFSPLVPDEDPYETSSVTTEKDRRISNDAYVNSSPGGVDSPTRLSLGEADLEHRSRSNSIEIEGRARVVSGDLGLRRTAIMNHSPRPVGGGSPADRLSSGLGWQISDISANILGKCWFHGFLSATTARERLQSEKAGSFLMRFSSVAPHFAIDLQDGTKVRHWRIEWHQKERMYTIHKDRYTSLQAIVDQHSTTPLRLQSGQLSVLLRDGVSRAHWDPTFVVI